MSIDEKAILKPEIVNRILNGPRFVKSEESPTLGQILESHNVLYSFYESSKQAEPQADGGFAQMIASQFPQVIPPEQVEHTTKRIMKVLGPYLPGDTAEEVKRLRDVLELVYNCELFIPLIRKQKQSQDDIEQDEERISMILNTVGRALKGEV